MDDFVEHEVAEAEDLTPGARQILDVASVLFYEHGIHAVGVDTIADESGVTKRTLYNNFGSKDALVSAYLQHRHTSWWERLDRRLVDAEPPRALTFFDVYADDAGSTTRGCAFLNAAGQLPVDHPGYAIVLEHKQSIEVRLQELIAADYPGATDPKRLARHVFLLLEGAFAHHGLYGPDLLVEAREDARELVSDRT